MGCPVSADHKLEKEKFIGNYWKERFEKATETINLWRKHHNLSLKGKTLIWNSLIISRFIHSGLIFSIPKNIIKDLDNLLKDFLWLDKKHLISLEKLTLPIAYGGLGLINLSSHLDSLRISFLKNAIQSPPVSKMDFLVFSLLHQRLMDVSPKPSFNNLIQLAKNKFGAANTRIRLNSAPTANLFNSALPPFYSSLWTSLSLLNSSTASWPKDNRETRFLLARNQISIPLNDYFKEISPFNSIQKERIFRILWKNNAPPLQNQVFFLFLHRALPLNDRLHLYANSICPFCKSLITPLGHEHLFLNCLITKDLLVNALHLLAPSLTISPSSLLYFIFSGGKVKNKRLQNSKLILLHRKWFHLVWCSFVSSLSLSSSSSSSVPSSSFSSSPSPSLSFILSSFIFSL